LLAHSYDLCLSQTVGLSDSYLALPGVHASPSASAGDALVLVVDLPGTRSVAELSLEVTRAALTLTSPLFRLVVALPRDVAPASAAAHAAKWDAAKARLRVTLLLAADA
jgi:hypothetical protein